MEDAMEIRSVPLMRRPEKVNIVYEAKLKSIGESAQYVAQYLRGLGKIVTVYCDYPELTDGYAKEDNYNLVVLTETPFSEDPSDLTNRIMRTIGDNYLPERMVIVVAGNYASLNPLFNLEKVMIYPMEGSIKDITKFFGY